MLKRILTSIPAVLALACILVLVDGQGEPECQENQRYDSCGTRCPDNCTHSNIGCVKVCAPDCFCKDGFVMEDSKTRHCVPKKLCDSCKGNTRYTSCGSSCQPSCAKRKVEVCTEECFVGCVCRDGYIRLKDDDKTSECVMPNKCP